MQHVLELDALKDRATGLVDAARKAGADSADATILLSRSLSVSVREGKLEETDGAEATDLGLRVFVGKKSALVSGSTIDRPQDLAERAVAMARATPEDPYAGLADRADLATEFPELDLFDGQTADVDALLALAHRIEGAMFAVAGVTKSGGVSASGGLGGMVLATSTGFVGSQIGSRHSLSATAIAGDGTRMERDYWYASKRHAADLPAAEEIGRIAAERTVRRLEPQQLRTQTATVVFEPRAASGLVGHLLGAINGASIARRTSFLQAKMGEQVFADGIRITDDPLKPRGLASRPFDGEGIKGEPLDLVTDGRLRTWLLDCASARELGLATNGRARRGAGAPSPGSSNVTLEPSDRAPDEIMREIGNGFLVTDLIGAGVNLVTGDYSRGAAGYWFENGEIAHSVSEVTIAGRLQDMFRRMVPANDLLDLFSVNAPTVAIEGMTIGGR